MRDFLLPFSQFRINKSELIRRKEELSKELENIINAINIISDVNDGISKEEKKKETDSKEEKTTENPIIKDGKVDLSNFEVYSSVSSEKPIRQKKSYSYKAYSSYSGCDSIILINNKIIDIIKEISFDERSYAILQSFSPSFSLLNNSESETSKEKMETNITLKCPVTSCTDNQIELIKNLKNGTITQILVNEYGQYMYREINGVNYKGESSSHKEDDITLMNNYKLSSDTSISSFKTLDDKGFIEKFGKIIKKVGTGQYEQV